MRKLLNWRKDNPVIHTGKLMHYTPMKHVYAYFRYDDDKTVMVVFNRGEARASVATDRFVERLGGATRGVDVITGTPYDIEESITLEPRSVLLLEIKP